MSELDLRTLALAKAGISKLSKEIEAQSILYPDDFEGTDSEKLQACIDSLLETGGTISINRAYTLTANVIVRNMSDYTRLITISGTGSSAAIDFGEFCIEGAEDVSACGNIKLCGLKLSGANIMVDATQLLRIFIDNCTITGFNHIVYSDTIIQTLYITNCIIRNLHNVAVKVSVKNIETDQMNGCAYDTKIAFNLIEWCAGLFEASSVHGCSITGNCIEGFSGTPITVRYIARAFEVKDNYFEANRGNCDIDLSHARYECVASICGNMFSCEYEGWAAIALPEYDFAGNVEVVGNSVYRSHNNLISVSADAPVYDKVYVFGNLGNISDPYGKLTVVGSADVINAVRNVGVVQSEKSGDVVSMTDASEQPMRGLKVYGKSTQDGTPTPETPADIRSIGDGENVVLHASGKNVFGGMDLAYALNDAFRGNGPNVEEGYVYLSTAYLTTGSVIFDKFKPNTRYTFVVHGRNSYTGASSVSCNLRVRYTDGTQDDIFFPAVGENSTAVLVSDEGKTIDKMTAINWGGISYIYYNKSGIFEGVIDETDYETYVSQSLTLTADELLCGIPVESGGNHVGKDGQARICDYKDYEAGVLVRHVGVIESYNGETIDTPYMSTTGGLDTGAKVLYALPEPVETRLSASDMIAYRQLHLLDGYNYIYTDEPCEFDLAYAADIDKHIAHNYVSRADFDSLAARITALEQG